MSESHLTFYVYVKNALADIKMDAYKKIQHIQCKTELDQLELSHLGLDSLDIFELIAYIEDKYSIRIDDSDVFSICRLGELKTIFEKIKSESHNDFR